MAPARGDVSHYRRTLAHQNTALRSKSTPSGPCAKPPDPATPPLSLKNTSVFPRGRPPVAMSNVKDQTIPGYDSFNEISRVFSKAR